MTKARGRGRMALRSDQEPRLPPPTLHFPVVGVGASAGGLEAAAGLLDAMPSDAGMAFVFVFHLDPTRESHLREILARRTSMPVHDVEDGMRIEPNHVYVIVPDSTLTIEGDRLRLSEPAESRGRRHPVDELFISLGQSLARRAVAVVLSGTGANGSAGLKEVKGYGGIVLAQDPATAKFPGMPRHAIDTGLVDRVLPVDRMPALLADYVRSPYVLDVGDADERQLADLTMLLSAHTAHDLSAYKRPTVLRRVRRRMALTCTASMKDYLELLRNDPRELDAFLEDLLINVTGFFRDPSVWEAFSEQVISPLVAERPNGATIRCWVAGCSTGEEAYSLAMLIDEAAEAEGKRFEVKIFATDTAETVISHARTGVYPEGISVHVSAQRLEKFFEQTEAGWQVSKYIRERVVFAPQNLLSDPPFSRVDIVTCRNVLIYLEPEVQRRVMALLHFALRESGALLLGTAESIGRDDDLFVPIDKQHRIYRRAGPTRYDLVDFPAFGHLGAAGRQSAAPPPPRPGRDPASIAAQALASFAPAAVLLDAQERVIYFHGNTEPFLTHPDGEPTRDLLTLARRGIRGKLRAVIREATKERRPASSAGRADGGSRIAITATPVRSEQDRGLLLVTFREEGAAADAQPAGEDTEAEARRSGSELEAELSASRAELRASVEELEAANEELKASNEESTSMNEELQSTNKELETSREELRSLNEELSTVNMQLHEKVDELEAATNDMTNLLHSSAIAVLYLDGQMKVKWFTPGVAALMNLIASDIGRPITHFAQRFSDDSLMEDAQRVLRSLAVMEREVQDLEGRWYIRRVLPYRTADDDIDGVAVTFVDFTARRRAEDTLRVRDRQVALAQAAARFEVWSLPAGSDDETVLSTFDCLPGKRGARVADSGHIHPEDRERVLEAYRAAQRGRREMAVEYRVSDPGRGDCWLLARGSLVRAADGGGTHLVGIVLEITERKELEEALREAVEGAEEASAAKDRFLAMLSHELRTPLNPVLLALSALEQHSEVAHAAAAELEVIRRNVEIEGRLIDDLLDLARIARGQLRLELQPVDAYEVLCSSLETCRWEIEQRSQRAVLEGKGGECWMHADPTRMQQVVWNVLRNAIKFTEEGGEIAMRCRCDDHHVVLEIVDNGVGMDGEMLGQLRASIDSMAMTAPGAGSPGLGLGLAIAGTHVRAHLGRLEIESAGLDRGSTVRIIVPAAEPRAAVAATTGDVRGVAPPASLPLRILLVEDHHDSAQVLARLLRHKGHAVEVAGSVSAALAAVAGDHPFDVLISDLALPDGNGLELMRRLVDSGIHGIAISGFGSAADIERSRAAGFASHVVKPISVADLWSALENVRSRLAAGAGRERGRHPQGGNGRAH